MITFYIFLEPHTCMYEHMLSVFCLSLSSLCWEKQNNTQCKYKVTGSKMHAAHMEIYFFDWGTGEGERK